MEPDALAPSLSYTEFVYNNESEVAPLYWPLSISQMITKRNAYELYTDNPDQYITYSGSWQSLLVAREKEGRYRSFTLRAYSGDSFKFYISTPSGVSGSRYYAGPLTSSGVYNTLQEYASENDARTNSITFTAPSSNSYVYSLPQVLPIDWVRLHHQSVVSGESYRLYQFLPRTLIQVDDLEADVIDAVTIRVSDSIVIGPDMIGDKTLLGRKIVDGTVSGILMTDGTITGSKIVANTISGVLITGGTITADKLSVANLEAVNTNTGNLTVNATLTVTSGQILAGSATVPTIINNNGVSIGSINHGLPTANALRILGSGSASNVTGIAFYNGQYNALNPLFKINIDGTNAMEFEMNQTQGGLVNFNFPTNSASSALQIFNGDLELRRASGSTNTSAPTIFGRNSSDATRYEINSNQILANLGSASVPGFSFLTDTNTGVYGDGSGSVGISSDGTLTVSFSGNQVALSPSGTVLLPSLTFNTDSNTGYYRISDGYTAITSNGLAVIGFTQTASNTQVRVENGSQDTPTYSFFNDTDTGIYRLAGGIGFSINDSLGAVLSTSNVFSVNTNNQNGQITVEVPSGTARNTVALRQLNDASAFINFQATIGAAAPIQTSALGTYYGKVRIQANGTVRWIALYNT
jgi:hypothetical protein